MSQQADRLNAALAGRYRIDRELGAGGMATVYLASDLKHDRKVAIKVLKPELAAVLGAERFVQEIKTTAALSHPHILPLFDSGTADGFLFYVMPYIEGETIRDRLNRERQLGIDEAVRITREIADALDYAHRHGVIHRDIKPENILLHDGRPMVMDFGIALAVSAAAGGRMTETGLSLGTPHYMSPEQATAEKEITGRSDVYSLASVLYEMLAGAPPHVGGSAQQIIMRIIADAPRPVTELRKSVPPNIAAALGRALEKLPADRFESARSFAEALGDRHFTTATATATAIEAANGSGRTLGPWLRSPLSRAAVALLALSIAAVAILLTRRGEASGPQPLMAFTVVDSLRLGGFAFADDGSIVRTATRQVFVRRPGELAETPLTGAEEGAFAAPILSPDGGDAVYASITGSGPTARTRLRRVSLRGGAATSVWTSADSRNFVRPVAWAKDGWIYVAGEDSVKLGRVRESGGELEWIVDGLFSDVEFLPGGKAFVGCVFSRSAQTGTLVAVDLATRDTVHIAADGCAVEWSPTGHLLVPHTDGMLRALPFDPARLRVTGPSTPVLSGIAVNNGLATFHLSNTGALLYVAGPSSNTLTTRSTLTLSLASLDGSVSPLPLPTTDHPDGGFSPDGKTLAYTRDDQIWLYDMELGTHRRFTRVGTEIHDPVFSPDGKRLAYRALRTEGKGGEVYVQALDGDTLGVHIGGGPAGDDPIQWLPDGRIVTERSPSDIVTLNADKPGDPVAILEADWAERYPRVSPDGKWLAYQSNESGRGQLMVRAWPALDRRSLIADSVSSSHVFWSNDGRTLYYQSRNRLMAAAIAGGDSLRAESHRVIIASLDGNLSAMHPDGRRFLVFRFPEAAATGGLAGRRSLVAVTGWLDGLRRRLAAEERR